MSDEEEQRNIITAVAASNPDLKKNEDVVVESDTDTQSTTSTGSLLSDDDDDLTNQDAGLALSSDVTLEELTLEQRQALMKEEIQRLYQLDDQQFYSLIQNMTATEIEYVLTYGVQATLNILEKYLGPVPEEPPVEEETNDDKGDGSDPTDQENPQNQKPTDILINRSVLSEGESGQAVLELSAVDKDGVSGFHTFMLLSDTSDLFFIDGNKVYLKPGVSLDFETLSRIKIIIRVSDQDGLSFDKSFVLRVEDKAEIIQLTDEGAVFVDLGVAELQIYGGSGNDVITAHATQGSVIRSGAGDDRVITGAGIDVVDGGGGTDTVVYSGNWRDYIIRESNGVYSLKHQFDGSGKDTITNVEKFQFADRTLLASELIDKAPTGLSLSTTFFEENNPGAFATLSAIDPNDPDGVDIYTYTLTNDGKGLFVLEGNTLRLSSGRMLDYEQAETHQISIIVTDSTGYSFEKVFVINTLDVAEHLNMTVDTVYREKGVSEKSVVGTSGNDTFYGLEGNDTFYGLEGNDTFYESGGNDVISGGTGKDTFILKGKWSDYEITEDGGVFKLASRVDQSVYDLIDGIETFKFSDKTLDLNSLLDVAPTNIIVEGLQVSENSAAGTVVATLQAIDPNDPDGTGSYSYAIVGDQKHIFKVVGNTIVVADSSQLNFEGLERYDLNIRATDGSGHHYIKTITITINDVAENVVLSDAGEQIVDRGVNELSITGGSGDDTITGGFGDDIIDGGAGTDTAIFAGNYGDYAITYDGATDTFVLVGPDGTDTVTGVENFQFDDQTVTYANLKQGSDQTLDGTGGDDTLSGGSGDDAIDGLGGNDTVVFTGDWADYTITENAGVYTVVDNRVGSPDGTDTVTNVEFFQFADGTVAVGDVLNDTPTDIGSVGNAVDENAASGTVVATLSATDADSGIASETATFAMTNDASGFFEIVGNEVRVKAGATLNYEAASSHDITVEVTDVHGETYSEVITITVNDVAEAITISGTFVDTGVARRPRSRDQRVRMISRCTMMVGR
jgi:Ca2+-binding RTX toxin-like protein